MIRHYWLDMSLGLNTAFTARANLLRLTSSRNGYRCVRRVLRIELFGLSIQIGAGTGVEA